MIQYTPPEYISIIDKVSDETPGQYISNRQETLIIYCWQMEKSGSHLRTLYYQFKTQLDKETARQKDSVLEQKINIGQMYLVAMIKELLLQNHKIQKQQPASVLARMVTKNYLERKDILRVVYKLYHEESYSLVAQLKREIKEQLTEVGEVSTDFSSILSSMHSRQEQSNSQTQFPSNLNSNQSFSLTNPFDQSSNIEPNLGVEIYLKDLNAKGQLNLFFQHHGLLLQWVPGQPQKGSSAFSSVCILTIPEQKRTLFDNNPVFKERGEGSRKQMAEEQAAGKLLLRIYSTFPELWKEIKDKKKKKGIP